METELRQLAFSEGGEEQEQLTTEDLMLAKIKSLAVTVLHASVHIVTHLYLSNSSSELNSRNLEIFLTGTNQASL